MKSAMVGIFIPCISLTATNRGLSPMINMSTQNPEKSKDFVVGQKLNYKNYEQAIW